MVWGLNWKLRDSTSESMNFVLLQPLGPALFALLAALLLGGRVLLSLLPPMTA